MSNKLFLTSICAICMSVPASADPTYITNQSQCNTDTFGSSGSANLIAEWEANTYTCSAGQYLHVTANDASCTTCPANSFCEGFGDYEFEDTDYGATSCADEYPNYPYSAAGTTSGAMCYATGNVTCATLNPYTGGHGSATYANATASGKSYEYVDESDGFDDPYVLDNTSACAITSLNCNTGYTADNGGALQNYVYQPFKFDETSVRYNNPDGINKYPLNTSLPISKWEIQYSDNTTISGSSRCVRTLAGDNDNHTWSNNGAIWSISEADGLTAATGVNPGAACWCKMDSFSTSGGGLVEPTERFWIFTDRYEIGPMNMDTSACRVTCSAQCVQYMMQYRGFRTALFGNYGKQKSCAANTIGLDWNPDNGDAHTQNTCVYDGAVTIPPQPEKVGHRFLGWRVTSTTP